jgi:excinuclease ABC subunit A
MKTKSDLRSAAVIHIKGAREHNLKHLELCIPHNQLVVITGVSGSGKSSLAFDTLYAEGYRKYIDSLSTHARQLLEQVKRPEVDYIHGLSPVIAIEQRSGRGINPRSTVATVTEIADYLRLLWCLCGEDRCPLDGGKIQKRSLDDCIDRVFQEPTGSRIQILAHLMTAKAALIREELPRLRQRGFLRVRINKTIYELDQAEAALNVKGKEVELDIVVDRLVLKSTERSRVADSLELAFKEGADTAIIISQSSSSAEPIEYKLSQHLSCTQCNTVYEALTPKHFSHNHITGACSQCDGLGRTLQFTEELVVPDTQKSVEKGAIKAWRFGSKSMIMRYNAILRQLAQQLPFDATIPWKDLPRSVQKFLLYGNQEKIFEFKGKKGILKQQDIAFEGVIPGLQRLMRETKSDNLKTRLLAYQISAQCPKCSGLRLNQRGLAVKLENTGFAEFISMDIQAASEFIEKLVAKKKTYVAVWDVLQGIRDRLQFLQQVGLDYLALNREYVSLSGGESQRVRFYIF